MKKLLLILIPVIGVLFINADTRDLKGYVNGVFNDSNNYYLEGWTCLINNEKDLVVDVYTKSLQGHFVYLKTGEVNQPSNQAIKEICNSHKNSQFKVLITEAEMSITKGMKLFVKVREKKTLKKDAIYQLKNNRNRDIRVPNPNISLKGYISSSTLVKNSRNEYRVEGWACDKMRPKSSLRINVYKNNISLDNLISSGKTGQRSSSTINQICNGGSDHAFSFVLKKSSLALLESDKETQLIFTASYDGEYTPEEKDFEFVHKEIVLKKPRSMNNSINIPQSEMVSNTIEISPGKINDHSDHTIPHSIAWYLNKFRDTKTYKLKPGEFKIKKTRLFLMKNIYLEGSVNNRGEPLSKIVVERNDIERSAIQLYGKTIIKNLIIDGGRKVSYGIDAGVDSRRLEISDLIFDNIRVLRTFSPDFTNFSDNISYHSNFKQGHGSLLHAKGAKYVAIKNSYFGYAGVDLNTINVKKEVSPNFRRWSNGINLSYSRHTFINNVGVNYTLGGSLAIPNSNYGVIKNSYFANSGLMGDIISYTAGQDSIIGYRNTAPKSSNLTIENNTIRNYRNNGIHVSGNMIIIKNNTITPGRARSIYVGDDKFPKLELSKFISIYDNEVDFNNELSNNYSNPIQLNYFESSSAIIKMQNRKPSLY